MKKLLKTIMMVLLFMPLLANAKIIINDGNHSDTYYVYYHGAKKTASTPSNCYVMDGDDSLQCEYNNSISIMAGNWYWDASRTQSLNSYLTSRGFGDQIGRLMVNRTSPYSTTNPSDRAGDYLCECVERNARGECCKKIHNDLHLYAGDCNTSIVVNFVTNTTEIIHSQTYDPNGNITLPVPHGDGFLGWYSDSSLNTKFDMVFESDGNGCFPEYTLYAKWDSAGNICPPVNDNYLTLSFNSNGGSEVSNIKITSEGASAPEIPIPTRAGYKFIGWYIGMTKVENMSSSDLFANASQIYDNNECPTGEYSLTFTARWEKENCPKPTSGNLEITFNDNGSHVISKPMTDSSKSVPEVSTSKTGFKFVGWYLDKGLTIKADFTSHSEFVSKYNDYIEYQLDKDDCPTGNGSAVVYAKWEKLDPDDPTPSKECKDSKDFIIQYTLDDNAGSSDIIGSQNKYLTDFSTPSRNGYKFIGWYKDKDLTKPISENEIVDSDIAWTDEKDSDGCITLKRGAITLYAKWDSDSGSSKQGVDKKTIDENPHTGAATPFIITAIGLAGCYIAYRNVKKKTKFFKI